MAGFAPKVHPAKHCDSSTICASSREQTCAAPQGTMAMRGVWRCEVPQNRHHPLGSSQLPHVQHQNQAVCVDLRAWPPPPQFRVVVKDSGASHPLWQSQAGIICPGRVTAPLCGICRGDNCPQAPIWTMSAGLESSVTFCHPS